MLDKCAAIGATREAQTVRQGTSCHKLRSLTDSPAEGSYLRLPAIQPERLWNKKREFGGDGTRLVAWSWLLLLLVCLQTPNLLAVEKGDVAPDFTLPPLRAADIAKAQVLSLSDFRGKVVYLDFWDSWCGPCRESLPALDGLRSELSRDAFEIVAVNLDADPAAGRRFLAQYPVTYPVASDPSANAAAAYRLSALPTSFLIDRDGVVHHVHQGFRKEDIGKIRAELVKLIAAD